MRKFSFFRKKDFQPSQNDEQGELITEVSNWYADRYEHVLVQRNLLLLIVLLSFGVIMAGVVVVRQVSLSKSVDPFVIEIEERTGITNVVNPLSRKDLTTNEALNTYFIMKYLRARETYDYLVYRHNFSTVVRLLSSFSVYNAFKNFINNDPKSPIKIYGTNVSTTLKVRSIQFLEGTTAQVRFTIIRNGDNNAKSDKIATITFTYLQMEMTPEERYVNPLGFQVVGYRIDDEIL